MARQNEARRVIDGDMGFLKIAPPFPSNDRGKLQAIEGDRVKTPTQDLPRGFDPKQWTNGVKLSTSGAAQAYAIHKRVGSGMKLDRIVPARNICWHGFYDRFDQARGISPVTAALNSLQDVYEGFDYALAKVKISQMFGLVFYRDAIDAVDGVGTGTTPTIDTDGDGEADSGYEVDFGRGPVQIDLEPGDKAEFLEAKTPATETVNLLRLEIESGFTHLHCRGFEGRGRPAQLAPKGGRRGSCDSERQGSFAPHGRGKHGGQAPAGRKALAKSVSDGTNRAGRQQLSRLVSCNTRGLNHGDTTHLHRESPSGGQAVPRGGGRNQEARRQQTRPAGRRAAREAELRYNPIDGPRRWAKQRKAAGAPAAGSLGRCGFFHFHARRAAH